MDLFKLRNSCYNIFDSTDRFRSKVKHFCEGKLKMSKFTFMKQDNMNQTIIDTDEHSLESIKSEFTKQLQNVVQQKERKQQEPFEMQENANQMKQNFSNSEIVEEKQKPQKKKRAIVERNVNRLNDKKAKLTMNKKSFPMNKKAISKQDSVEVKEVPLYEVKQEQDGMKDEFQAILKQELSGVKEELVSVKKELAGVNQDLVGVKQELAGVNQELVGVNKDLVGVKQELAGVNQELAGVKKELAGMKMEQFGVRKEQYQLQQEANQVKPEYEQLQNSMDFLMNTVMPIEN